MSRTANQRQKVFMHLRRRGTITDTQARGMGIRRLAARIYELRENGAIIFTFMVKVKDAEGEFTHVARYRAAGLPHDKAGMERMCRWSVYR